VPSPKFHRTLVTVTDGGLVIAVNVTGNPAAATLVEVASDTDSTVGLAVR
jgi:hypothetical protein